MHIDIFVCACVCVFNLLIHLPACISEIIQRKQLYRCTLIHTWHIHTDTLAYTHTHILYIIYTYNTYCIYTWYVYVPCMECNYGLCPWHGPLRPIRMLAKLENNVAALKLVVGQDRQAMHRNGCLSCISSKYSQYVQHMRHILMRIPRINEPFLVGSILLFIQRYMMLHARPKLGILELFFWFRFRSNSMIKFDWSNKIIEPTSEVTWRYFKKRATSSQQSLNIFHDGMKR